MAENNNQENGNQQEYIKPEMSYADCVTILTELLKKGLTTKREFVLLKTVIAPKTLACPIKIDDKIRSNILKNVVLQLINGGDYDM